MVNKHEVMTLKEVIGMGLGIVVPLALLVGLIITLSLAPINVALKNIDVMLAQNRDDHIALGLQLDLMNGKFIEKEELCIEVHNIVTKNKHDWLEDIYNEIRILETYHED